ncbi:MAG: type IV pilus modification protein PilV [Pseudomonadota bacterium]
MLRSRNTVPQQRGFSLLEVLIALVILSLGMLGLAGLQAVSLKTNANAHLRSQAVILAYDMIDRMRSNSGNVASYALAFADDAPATPATVAENDLSQWLDNISATLPAGDGEVEIAGGAVTVRVRWTERAAAGETANTTHTYELSTRI